jgi:cell division protein FtsB
VFKAGIVPAMAYRDLEPISKQLTIVVGLTVVGFMTFGLALSFYRNILFEETLQSFSSQNDKLREEIYNTRAELEYFRSGQFKDKYAKETLGKLNPGEKMLILSQDPSTISAPLEDPADDADVRQAVYEEVLGQMPVIQHWNLYFFHRDKLEELKSKL